MIITKKISSFATTMVMAYLLVPGALFAATINVPADQATIQGAVTAASAGDTIVVAAGTYAEHVTINKPLILKGANAGTPGNGVRVAETVITGATTGALQLTADNITIDGFKISSPLNDLGTGIHMAATISGANIINNLITGNQMGIYANSAGTSTISGNLFDANNESGSAGGTGIYSEFTQSMTIANNEFKNHTTSNPIIFGATAAAVHKNLVVTTNNIHNNASGIYVLGVSGGSFTNNIISAADATALSFSGADTNITVTGNTLQNSARGVRIEDGGYGLGINSAIVVNRNSITGNTDAGVANLGGFTGSADATCNWWGAANGPGLIASGSGDKVTSNVTFSPWLSTAVLDGTCNGGVAPTAVTVTIDKYVDGVQATTVNANNASFPMHAIFPGGEGDYALAPVGFNNANPYQATTGDMAVGSNYSTFETLPTTCDAGNPFALVGYSTGSSLAAAALVTPTTTVPAFTNLQSNQFVIVWNKTCVPTTTPTIKVHIVKYLDGKVATASSSTNYVFPMTATWATANLNGGATTTGSFGLGTGFGGAENIYGADTAAMSVPANYATSEITDATSQVVSDPASCAAGKFVLEGYKTSAISFTDAALQSTSSEVSFTGLQSDRFVIVLNKTCATTGSLTIQKDTIGGNGTFNFVGNNGIGAFSITTAGNSGSKTFTNLAPGTYTITEATSSGWTMSDSECASVVVAAGSAPVCTITNTKNTRLGEIRGTKFEDRDGDSKLKDGDHHRLSGWTIYIDTNNNSVLDTGEPTSVTDAHGNYRFTGLVAGTYRVREVQQTGWIQTVPSTGSYSVVLAAGKIAKKKDFGNFHLVTISGMKYNDINANGRKNAGDGGLAGWTIQLKKPNGSIITTVTDATGAYSFIDLGPGTYKLSEVMQTGWRQTDKPGTIRTQSGSVLKNQNFGNTQKQVSTRGDRDDRNERDS